MNLGMDTSTVAQNVQLALAPVFFLTAVAGMIAVVAGRLARIVDRARVVELALENASKTTEVEKICVSCVTCTCAGGCPMPRFGC